MGSLDHEKWNGRGYPHGLKGEEIPIGARILATVDCFDALVSDRQYRKALPLDEAMAKVASEAGISFDPRVVEILERRYAELERLVKEQPLSTPPKLSTDIRIKRAAGPSAGFSEAESLFSQAPETKKNSAAVVANAPTEPHDLFELCHELRDSLSVDDILSLMSVRLKRLVPHESLAICLLRDGILTPKLVSGENFSLFSSLRVPLREGLCGWVA